MPRPGDILLIQKYRFEDGSERDKLFVVLNATDLQLPCLVLMTTSQAKRYLGAQKGCNPDKRVFFVPMEWKQCFPLDTYIQLPKIFEFSMDELMKKWSEKQMSVKGSLLSDCLDQLRNCLKRFKRDISGRDWDLLFKRRKVRK